MHNGKLEYYYWAKILLYSATCTMECLNTITGLKFSLAVLVCLYTSLYFTLRVASTGTSSVLQFHLGSGILYA